MKSDINLRSGFIRLIIWLFFGSARASVNMIMALGFCNMVVTSILAQQLLASQVEDSFKKFVY